MARRVAVVGSGRMGTCVAGVLSEQGNRVTLWSHAEDVRDEILERRENPRYLPGYRIPAAVRVTCDVAEAAEKADVVIMVVASNFFRRMISQIAGVIASNAIVVSLTKGIEESSLKRMSEVATEVLPAGVDAGVAVLSGPNFATEIARGLPTASVAAAGEPEPARLVQELFASPRFRVYTSDDVVGVELGGAAKNVIAIAAGMCAGLNLGHNARAAVITRGLAEIMRLGSAMGAQPLTLAGLAGVGDLVLTCTSEQSLNYSVGQRLGRGERLPGILASIASIPEGVATTKSINKLAAASGVDMPIAKEVRAVLFEGRGPRDAVERLMSREPKPELKGLQDVR